MCFSMGLHFLLKQEFKPKEKPSALNQYSCSVRMIHVSEVLIGCTLSYLEFVFATC